MLETVRHLATQGVDRFIYFNAAGGDGSELQTVLDEVNGRLTNVNTYGADLSRIDPNSNTVVSTAIQRDGSVLRYSTGADGNGAWDTFFPDPPPGGGGGGSGGNPPPSPITAGRKLQAKMVDGVRRLVKTAAGFLAAGCNCCANQSDRCREVYRTTQCYTPLGCEDPPTAYVCADAVDRLFAEQRRACVVRLVTGSTLPAPCYTVDRTRRYNASTLPPVRDIFGHLGPPYVLGQGLGERIQCVPACSDPTCIQTDAGGGSAGGGERQYLRAIPCDPANTNIYYIDALTVRRGCKVVPLEGLGTVCGRIQCDAAPVLESQLPPGAVRLGA
jgi:hypothetical protein